MAENRELALVLKLVADNFQTELKKSQASVEQFNGFIKDWKIQLTAVGAALVAVAKSTANFGEEALKGSQKTGLTVETFTALSYAAKLADIDQQQLIVGLKSLSQNMVEAARQTGDGEAVFRRLGVSATDAAGQLRPTEKVLLDLADVFEQSADGAGKTEVAVKLFGKAGIDLIPFLNQGKAGITALTAEAVRLGVTLSKEDAEAADKLNNEIKRMDSAMRGLTLVVGKELLPVFTELMNGMTSLTSSTGLGTFVKAMVFGFEDWAISIKLAAQQMALLAGNVTDLFSADTARALGKQMDDLAASAEERRIAAAGRISGESPAAASTHTSSSDKPLIALGSSKLQADELQARHVAAEQAIKDRLALLKTGFDRERLLIDASVADGMASEVRAAEERVAIKNQELAAEAQSFLKLKELAVRYFKDRLALGFKDADERLKFETDYHKNVTQLNQQEKLAVAAITNEKLRGEIEVGQAKARTAKTNLELLFKGAESIKADRQAERDQLVDNLKAWIEYDTALGASTEVQLAHRMDLTRAELAKELDLNVDQAGRLLIAWQNHDYELATSILATSTKTAQQIEAIQLRTLIKAKTTLMELSGDFFDGWAEGMRKYVQDTASGFGLAADMARRSFQMVEQTAGKFFFDAMEGRIQRFKDVMTSFLNFAKQIASQLMGQLITKQLAGALAGAAPGFFGLGGAASLQQSFAQSGTGFATGGSFRVPGSGGVDTMPVGFWATPGETVSVRRPGDVEPASVGVQVIVNNYGNNDVQTSTSRGSDGRLVITQTIRDTVRGLVSTGDLDGALGRRYGINPTPGRR